MNYFNLIDANLYLMDRSRHVMEIFELFIDILISFLVTTQVVNNQNVANAAGK